MKTDIEQPKRGAGRPPGRTREQRAVNLEPKVWAWLESQKQAGESLNDALNRILTDDMNKLD